jgi:hypothetical protein
MRRLEISIVGLCLGLALPAGSALAQGASPPAGGCCEVASGTVVEIAVEQDLSSQVQRTGDTFALKLAAPLIVNGRVVLRAGTPGVGEVIDAAKPGMGGKAGKLVLAARYLLDHGQRIPLQSLRLAANGKDNSMTANAVGLTGFVFMPLGFAGLAVKGGDAAVPAGTVASAKVAADVGLPPLARASSRAIADANAFAAATNAQPADDGAIPVPPPPAGEGQVVFFRAKSLLGTGQWFKVREEGQALGKLTNGAYFVQVTQPGVHTYTATTEPEAKDKLKLQIDPGETYYVEGVLTKGVVMGVADLTPSDRATFAKASKDLKPAPSGADDTNDATNDLDDTNAPSNDAASAGGGQGR